MCLFTVFVWFSVMRNSCGEIYMTRAAARKNLRGVAAGFGAPPVQSIFEAMLCIVSTMRTAMGG
jgi:hypothetical protein